MLRHVLAANVAALLPIVFHDAPNPTAREKLLARAAGVSHSTVQRILSAETGATIDNIEHIARALGTSAVELITPTEQMQRALGFAPRPSR